MLKDAFDMVLQGATFKTRNESAGLIALGGSWGAGLLSNSTSLYHNGSTYTLYYETNVTFNLVWISKQTGDIIEWSSVGIGTAGLEPYNHAVPILMEYNDFIYVAQNEFHVDRFKLYKSDSTEDISSFSLVGYFDTNGAYLVNVNQVGSVCYFITRTGGSPNLYYQSVLEVDLTNPSAYVKNQLIDETFSIYDTRHYPMGSYKYGNQTQVLGGGNLRYEGTSTYYGAFIWKTLDFITYSNLAGTFSKDITIAPITRAELETNFMVKGTNTIVTDRYEATHRIDINDDTYLCYRSGANTYSVDKLTQGIGFVATFTIPKSLYDTQNANIMRFNGSNIVMTCKMADETISFFTFNTDFSGFKWRRNLTTMVDGYYLGLPSNLHEIPEGDEYLIVGRSVKTEVGNVPVIITNNRWK